MGGFTAIPHGAMEGLSSSEQLVFFWLHFHHNRRTKKCFPGTRVLAKECGLSRPTVLLAIHSLVDKDKIGRKWSGRGTTCYYEILPVKKVVKNRSGGGKEEEPLVVKNRYPNQKKNQKNITIMEINKSSDMTPIKSILERAGFHDDIDVSDIIL